MRDVVAAYSQTAAVWQAGPGRIYDKLAEVVVGCTPVPLATKLVLDIGAGTGSASRAIARAGGVPVAVDPAHGMLAVDRQNRPPAVAADAVALAVQARAVGALVAAFSLNHLLDPAVGLREAARVTEPGGAIVISSYAVDDGHPVKEAVSAALTARGWQEPAWYVRLQGKEGVPPLATPDGCSAAAIAAGLDAQVQCLRVPFPELGAGGLVDWRLGMAHVAPFVGTLDHCERRRLVDDAVRRLDHDWPPLVRSILVLTAVV